MDWASKSLFYLSLVGSCKFIVNLFEGVPFRWTKSVDEGGEIVSWEVEDVFVTCRFRRLQVETNDAAFNADDIFQRSNEWSNVLESCSSDKFAGRVFKESEVDVFKLFSYFLYWWDFRDIRNEFSACFSHSFIFVISELAVKREYTWGEKVDWDNSRDAK